MCRGRAADTDCLTIHGAAHRVHRPGRGGAGRRCSLRGWSPPPPPPHISPLSDSPLGWPGWGDTGGLLCQNPPRPRAHGSWLSPCRHPAGRGDWWLHITDSAVTAPCTITHYTSALDIHNSNLHFQPSSWWSKGWLGSDPSGQHRQELLNICHLQQSVVSWTIKHWFPSLTICLYPTKLLQWRL